MRGNGRRINLMAKAKKHGQTVLSIRVAIIMDANKEQEK